MANTTNPAAKAGIIADLLKNANLVWRLFRDPRMGKFAKFAVPAALGAYLLMPIDLLPDMIPVLGQVDDLAVLALATRLFIQMAPPGVVREHLENMAGRTRSRSRGEGDVVDGDYRVIK